MSGGGRKCSSRLLTCRPDDEDDGDVADADVDGGVSRLQLLEAELVLAGVRTHEARVDPAVELSATLGSGERKSESDLARLRLAEASSSSVE